MLNRDFLVGVVALVLAWHSHSNAQSVDPKVLKALGYWEQYDGVLTLDATIERMLLTCVGRSSTLQKISETFEPSVLDTNDLSKTVSRFLQKPKTDESHVFFLSQSLNIIADGKRIRNEAIVGGSASIIDVNDGHKKMTFMPASSSPDSMFGNAILRDASSNTGFLGIDELLPLRKSVAILRTLAKQSDNSISYRSTSVRSIIDFSIAKFGMSCQLEFDELFNITRVRTTTPNSRSVSFFENFKDVRPVKLPMRYLEIEVKSGQEGPRSGFIKYVQVRRADLNPEIADDTFALFVPSKTTVQEFNNLNEVIGIVVTAYPVNNLGSVKNLSVLAESKNAGRNDIGWLYYSLALVLFITVVVVLSKRMGRFVT